MMSDKLGEFTCLCCRVAFKDGDIQRAHYKTDWHRYNLKRKVADLPPVTSEEFQRRVITQRATDAELTKDTSQYCRCCRKTFTNARAYDNHLNSKRHKDNETNYVETPTTPLTPVEEKTAPNIADDAMSVESAETDSDVEELDSDEWDDDFEVDFRKCLFCEHHSRTFLRNVKHMSVSHTFFVPDVEYCTDVRGLFAYLAEKIDKGFMCLWCNEKGRTFHSAEAARSHMLDKGHCKMLHEGVALAEYADFYDYSASYPDAEEANVDVDDEVEVPELDGNEYQLVLPSGVVVGHRSLMRYYKQSVNPSRAIVPVDKGARKLHKVLATYRAIGWSPAHQEAAARKARDIHYMKRLQSRHVTKLSVKANKLQKHFRQQVNF